METKKKQCLAFLLLVVFCFGFPGIELQRKVEDQTYRFPSTNTEYIFKRSRTREIHYYRKDTSPEKTEELQFLQNFKNPCWKEEAGPETSVRIRCLPYFYLVGAPRCGTTDLSNRLVKHPTISKRVPKETHWLARKRFYSGKSNKLSNYLRLFDRAVQRDIISKQHNGYHYSIFGDCSSSNLWDNTVLMRRWKSGKIRKPYYTNANVIYNLTKHSKILILLRNPVTRLYSDYLAFTRRGVAAAEFHDKVAFSIDHFKYCLKKHDQRYCAYFQPNTGVRLHIGLYNIFIEDYIRVFPRNQIKILTTEQFSKNITSTMIDVFNFLEVGIPPEGIMKGITSQGKSNGNIRRQAGKMLPETYTLLSRFYKPYNDKLVKLFGDRWLF